MRELWMCLDCQKPVELNTSGRCECCDSDAVDTVERMSRKKAFAPAIAVSCGNHAIHANSMTVPQNTVEIQAGLSADSPSASLLRALALRMRIGLANADPESARWN